MYDYAIVGAGLFGSICARSLTDRGYKCLVIDKRDHIGGNCYTDNSSGIHVHKYGPHIFHTNDDQVWGYINRFTSFNRFTFSPVARYDNKLYSLPFNLWTFYQIYGVTNPNDALEAIDNDRFVGIPENLEEAACALVGYKVYECLIKGYTKKQWGRDPKMLPASIIKRLPVRMVFNADYFDDRYQGIPEKGYTHIFENLLKNIDLSLNVDYIDDRNKINSISKKVIYTGPIDRYFNYLYGSLDYKTMYWDTKNLDIKNYQGTAVINETSDLVPYTRVIEHKHFDKNSNVPNTIVSYEYSKEYNSLSDDPMYPVNDAKNNDVYLKYKNLSYSQENVIFGGRLAEYKYYDMDKVIKSALNLSKNL